jgi:hypothetical protein
MNHPDTEAQRKQTVAGICRCLLLFLSVFCLLCVSVPLWFKFFAVHEEVGFAHSLLAYELPDGRLKLIDGHLRRDLDPDMEVEVEVLDVTEEEARTLLLSIDPLAALAETQTQLHQRLLELTPTPSPDLEAAWPAAEAAMEAKPAREIDTVPEQYLLLLTCRDEQHQVELLERFQGEGLQCKALLS